MNGAIGGGAGERRETDRLGTIDFTPLTASDDGTTLRLVRPFRWSHVVGRTLIYGLLLCIVSLFGVMGYGIYLRGLTLESGLAAAAMGLVLLLTARFLVFWLGMDGVSWAEFGPRGLRTCTKIGFGRQRVDEVPVTDLCGVQVRLRSAKPRSAMRRVWWLEMAVATTAAPVSLGWLHAEGADDPNPYQAVGEIARRLGVPVEGAPT